MSQDLAHLIADSIRESARAVLVQKGIAPDVAEMLSKEIGNNAACGVVFAIEEQEVAA